MARKGHDWSLVEPFYEAFDSKDRLSYLPGQLCWALAVYPYDPPIALDLIEGSYDPKTDAASFSIARRKLSDDPPEHLPVKSLNLQTDEHLIVLKSKRRQVVVLGNAEVGWLENPQKFLLCAPIFTFKDRHTAEDVIRIQGLQFPSLFYLPEDVSVNKEESVVRLELSQCIQKGWLQPAKAPTTAKPIRLSRQAYQLLAHQLAKFTDNQVLDKKIESELTAYREALFEEYSIP